MTKCNTVDWMSYILEALQGGGLVVLYGWRLDAYKQINWIGLNWTSLGLYDWKQDCMLCPTIQMQDWYHVGLDVQYDSMNCLGMGQSQLESQIAFLANKTSSKTDANIAKLGTN